MLDIWRAAAPKLDFIAPDIYIADFPGVCESFTRSGNPPFISEARDDLGNPVLGCRASCRAGLFSVRH